MSPAEELERLHKTARHVLPAPPPTDSRAVATRVLLEIAQSPSSENSQRIRACELLLTLEGFTTGATK